MKVGLTDTNISVSLYTSIAFNCITYQLYFLRLHTRLKVLMYGGNPSLKVIGGKFHGKPRERAAICMRAHIDRDPEASVV